MTKFRMQGGNGNMHSVDLSLHSLLNFTHQIGFWENHYILFYCEILMPQHSSGCVHWLTEKLPQCSVSVSFFGRNSKTALSLKHFTHNPGVFQQLLNKPQSLEWRRSGCNERERGKDGRVQVRGRELTLLVSSWTVPSLGRLDDFSESAYSPQKHMYEACNVVPWLAHLDALNIIF